VTSDGGDASDGFLWHGKFRPPIADNTFSRCDKGHEPVSALQITGWPKTNAAHGTLSHVVAVLLMGLDICAKRYDSMF
jgi:hypothetical protein